MTRSSKIPAPCHPVGQYYVPHPNVKFPRLKVDRISHLYLNDAPVWCAESQAYKYQFGRGKRKIAQEKVWVLKDRRIRHGTGIAVWHHRGLRVYFTAKLSGVHKKWVPGERHHKADAHYEMVRKTTGRRTQVYCNGSYAVPVTTWVVEPPWQNDTTRHNPCGFSSGIVLRRSVRTTLWCSEAHRSVPSRNEGQGNILPENERRIMGVLLRQRLGWLPQHEEIH